MVARVYGRFRPFYGHSSRQFFSLPGLENAAYRVIVAAGWPFVHTLHKKV
jgi:hypothetical protein